MTELVIQGHFGLSLDPFDSLPQEALPPEGPKILGNGQLSLIFGVPNFCTFSLLVLCFL